METIKDPYSVERIAEQVLHQLAAQNASDVEGYWILWILFHRTYKRQISVRYLNYHALFDRKFEVIYAVFPILLRCINIVLFKLQ